jgi:hypothetical protein
MWLHLLSRWVAMCSTEGLCRLWVMMFVFSLEACQLIVLTFRAVVRGLVCVTVGGAVQILWGV